MHIRIPFLAVLIITIFQMVVYGIQNNEHHAKDFDEILNVQWEGVTKITMIDLSGKQRQTKNPEQIETFVNLFQHYQYKRLRNDQTAYMPNKTMSIIFYGGDETDFIIPYGKEIFISNKVYQIKNGTIKEEDLLGLFHMLPKN